MKNFLTKNNVIAGLVIIIIILLSILLNKPKPSTEIKFIPVKEKIEITDKEDIKNHTKVVNTKDSFIYVPTTVVDTFTDTIKIPILIEYKTFKDTIDTDTTSTSIEVNYEGFMAQINSVKLEHRYYNKQTTITKAKSPWSFGIQLGVGVGYGQYVDFKQHKTGQGMLVGGYVGIGIAYNF
jgi:hypothetical protein